jgi:protocatechuate 3,4-dioxygenase beta subunit
MTTSNRPVPGAVLDVWQADADGRYDDEITSRAPLTPGSSRVSFAGAPER